MGYIIVGLFALLWITAMRYPAPRPRSEWMNHEPPPLAGVVTDAELELMRLESIQTHAERAREKQAIAARLPQHDWDHRRRECCNCGMTEIDVALDREEFVYHVPRVGSCFVDMVEFCPGTERAGIDDVLSRMGVTRGHA